MRLDYLISSGVKCKYVAVICKLNYSKHTFRPGALPSRCDVEELCMIAVTDLLYFLHCLCFPSFERKTHFTVKSVDIYLIS